MKIGTGTAAILRACLTVLVLAQLSHAHVTLQSSQPLRPGVGYANIVLNVPNERHVDNTKISLEVPEAFLKAGGRLNRVIYPAGWTVTIEKKDKPPEVYGEEMDARSKRDTERQAAAGAEHNPDAKTEQDQQEKQIMDELRKKWITKVTFEGGAIPPDGFQQFVISFQLPDDPGRYRFAAVQTYADGKEVSWSELVEGAEHPAAALNVEPRPLISYGDLPVPLSALALVVSLIALVRISRAPKASAGSATVAHGNFASASGD